MMRSILKSMFFQNGLVKRLLADNDCQRAAPPVGCVSLTHQFSQQQMVRGRHAPYLRTFTEAECVALAPVSSIHTTLNSPDSAGVR